MHIAVLYITNYNGLILELTLLASLLLIDVALVPRPRSAGFLAISLGSSHCSLDVANGRYGSHATSHYMHAMRLLLHPP